MTNLTDTTRTRPGLDVATLDRTDRLLLGGCAVVWLAALGAAVAAVVALVDLARGHAQSAGGSGTPWVLYTIIGVSAAVIVAAVPLLLRARRTTESEAVPAPAPRAESAPPPVRGLDAPTEKLRVARPVEASGPLPTMPGSSAANSPVTDQMYLRCTASIAAAMGVATLLISAATYLMAVDSDTAAWVLYGLAGAVTVGMCALPWYFLRELRSDTES